MSEVKWAVKDRRPNGDLWWGYHDGSDAWTPVKAERYLFDHPGESMKLAALRAAPCQVLVLVKVIKKPKFVEPRTLARVACEGYNGDDAWDAKWDDAGNWQRCALAVEAEVLRRLGR